MKIIQHYAQGAEHKACGMQCKERTYSLKINDVTVIALADGGGCEESKYAAVCAECVAKAIADFLCNNFDKFYNMRDDDEMKKVFIAVCKQSFHVLAGENGIDDIQKLSSTLMVVAAKGSKALVCHLGGGAIGKVTEAATRVISAPDKHICSVSDSDAEDSLRIQKCKIDNVVAFFTMSDGMADCVFDETGMRFSDSARKMALLSLEENAEEKLAETIEKSMIELNPKSEDCSFIAMVFDERVTSPSVGVSEIRYEGLYENINEGDIAEDPDISFSREENEEEYEESFPVDENRKQHKLIAAFMAIIVAVVAVFCIVLAKSASEKNRGDKFIPEKTTAETEVNNIQPETEEKTSAEDASTSDYTEKTEQTTYREEVTTQETTKENTAETTVVSVTETDTTMQTTSAETEAESEKQTTTQKTETTAQTTEITEPTENPEDSLGNLLPVILSDGE